jgi:N-acetylmuramoyl-L-alanine amidase
LSIWTDFDIYSGALCSWREARGEGRDGIRGVIHVIANRAKLANKSWAEIIYQKWQFSSMTAPGDPQLCLVPQPPDAVFSDCCEIAVLVSGGGDFDLTSGATHYYATTIPEPEWAKVMRFTIQIGRQRFYK